MSGIIGGAGSKSGVIGTTELDYEEGTWTPIVRGYSPTTVLTFTGGAEVYTYTKVGNICIVTFSAVNVTTAWDGSAGGEVVIEGYPFGNEPGPQGVSSPIVIGSGGLDLPEETCVALVGPSGTGQILNVGGGYGFPSFTNPGSGSYLYYTITYRTA